MVSTKTVGGHMDLERKGSGVEPLTAALGELCVHKWTSTVLEKELLVLSPVNRDMRPSFTTNNRLQPIAHYFLNCCETRSDSLFRRSLINV